MTGHNNSNNNNHHHDSHNAVAEREAELIALQSAFDEYIASSRELEEELDAELSKMQDKLAESNAANAALSSQLENISPQLSSLETALQSARVALKQEQQLRRAAEHAQDTADQKVRELEQSLQTLREECDDVHEELAFKEHELEETRLELEVEQQQLENELARLRQQQQSQPPRAATTTPPVVVTEVTDGTDPATVTTKDLGATAKNTANTTDDDHEDEAYVRKLEEELELVTEQLIETEKRLSETETELLEKEQQVRTLQAESTKRSSDEDLVQILQTELSDLQEAEAKLRDQWTATQEELALAREEWQLQAEELQAAEDDITQTRQALEEERARHREAQQQLQIQLKEAELTSKSSLGEAAVVAETVQQVNQQNEQLLEQVERLENALLNAKRDYQNVLDELDQVNARFDEVRIEAERKGREMASEEIKAQMRLDAQHEIARVQESLQTLAADNAKLQQAVDEAEMQLAAARDETQSQRALEQTQERSQVVQKLQTQLARAKEDLVKKDQEMNGLVTQLEERLKKAEETTTQLESALSQAKDQLTEAEAHMIVLRRENKEKHSLSSSETPLTPRSPRHHDDSVMDHEDGESSPHHYSRARSSSPSSVMRLELRLAEEAKKYETLEKQYNDVVDQKRIGEVRIKRLEEDVKILQKQLFESSDGAQNASTTTQMSRLSSIANRALDDIANSSDVIAGQQQRLQEIIQSRDPKRMAEELQSLEKQCSSQREYNAQLLSKMLHLQGNIQVYCRVRPLSLPEIQSGSRCVIEALSETEVGCFDERTNKWKSFNFDRVWGPDQGQTSIFQDVEPLALSVVDGFNACIFAYGQTGSGKTYTMEGLQDKSQYGISYRTIQKIFYLLNLRAEQQRTAQVFVGNEESKEEVAFTFSLTVGMLEIYNDEIYDLLGSTGSTMQEKIDGAKRAGGKASLEIRRTEDGRIDVPNLTKEKVTSIQEVMDLLRRGNGNRATAATDLNEHSSRSHMVLSVEVASGLDETNSNKGTLYLVDLAGSERVRKSNVEGDNLKEAGFINKSLSALGNVMEALDRKSSHVPYRDSKLTYLLQNALGGNSRTMMVVTTCPMDNSYDETVHALQFATRVRRIQIGAAQRNVTSKNLEETVKTLTEEMRALARAKDRTEGQLLSLKRDNSRVQDKLQALSKSRSQGRADNKTLEVLRKNNDEMAARWKKEKTVREETAEELEKASKELRATQQQLGRYKGKLQSLEQKLEDKEAALERANELLRQERNQKSAAVVRSRRDELLNSRIRSPLTPTEGPTITTTKFLTPRPAMNSSERTSPSNSATTAGQATVGESSSETDVDVVSIRSQVLALLEKYDKEKAGRIDIIMEKFSGKEALLLEKMTERYEANSKAGAGGSSSIKTRNELALQRHQERMRRIHEKRAQQS